MIFLLMVRWPEQVALEGHTKHFACTIPCFTEYSRCQDHDDGLIVISHSATLNHKCLLDTSN